MKRIAIDFRKAASRARAGKGEYTYRVVEAMLASKQLKGWELILLTYPNQTVDLPRGGWRIQSFSAASPLLWQLSVWWWLTVSKGADVYWATTSFILSALVKSVPVVTTIFDFVVWRHPETSHQKTVRWEKRFVQAALDRSAAILAISEFTAKEARSLFGIQPDRLTVTPLGSNLSQPSRLEIKQAEPKLTEQYDLPKKFILYLGTLEPRKNLELLIDAFELASPKLPGCKLVLAGQAGWLADPILERAATSPDIVLTGYIPDSQRRYLYGMADVFVFPSIYEGFGLPPLEAMACGAPVIISDQPALIEVVGQAGRVVPMNNKKLLAEAMIDLVSHASSRALLRAKGFRRARQFTWEATAKSTLKVLKRYGKK